MDVSQRGNKAEVTVIKSETRPNISSSPASLDGSSFGIMAVLNFNVDHGYLEGLVRGMKAGILTQADYHNLAECDTLEGKNFTLFKYIVMN